MPGLGCWPLGEVDTGIAGAACLFGSPCTRHCLRLWLWYTGAPECPPRKSLDTYCVVVGWGLVRWGAHVRTMARREGLLPSTDTWLCPACRQQVLARHFVGNCPWWHLFRLAVHSHLAHAAAHHMHPLAPAGSDGVGRLGLVRGPVLVVNNRLVRPVTSTLRPHGV